LRRVTETLADIDSLDSVCLAYVARLGTLRSSKMFPSSTAVSTWTPSESSTPDSSGGAVAKNQHQRIFPTVSAPVSSSSSLSSLSARDQVTEERLIQEHLEELREEKAALAATLPSLARAASDDDLLSTDGDLDDQDSPIGGSVDDLPASSQSRSDSRPRGRWNHFPFFCFFVFLFLYILNGNEKRTFFDFIFLWLIKETKTHTKEKAFLRFLFCPIALTIVFFWLFMLILSFFGFFLVLSFLRFNFTQSKAADI
jgi:myosin-9